MQSVPHKTCSRKENCVHPDGPYLPVSEFGKYKSSKDGLRCQCKLCNRYYATKWTKEHPQENRDRAKQWVLDNPERALITRKDYYAQNRDRINKRNNDRYHANKHKPEYILKSRLSAKKSREKNKEKRRESRRRWRLENPEKSRVSVRNRRAKQRAAEGLHSAEDILMQHLSQNGKCWWCGKPVGDNYHVDHRIAIERGGSNWPNNICISCPRCNTSKSDKMPWEWIGRLL